jgi:hypothetical protein
LGRKIKSKIRSRHVPIFSSAIAAADVRFSTPSFA